MTPTVIIAAFLAPVGLMIAGALYSPRVMRDTSGVTMTIQKTSVTEWEHGWQTERVIATRYKNPVVGYNIGFTFPKNQNDCDRAELTDWMASKGGAIFQSGGYPGAEMFVVFKDVTDRDTANMKIKAILPELSQVITDLGNGKTIKIVGKTP